jgi:hypothetical protein
VEEQGIPTGESVTRLGLALELVLPTIYTIYGPLYTTFSLGVRHTGQAVRLASLLGALLGQREVLERRRSSCGDIADNCRDDGAVSWSGVRVAGRRDGQRSQHAGQKAWPGRPRPGWPVWRTPRPNVV